jgi:hypothetical protein
LTPITLEVKFAARTPSYGGRNANLICLNATARVFERE